jgi:hypothetical protein
MSRIGATSQRVFGNGVACTRSVADPARTQLEATVRPKANLGNRGEPCKLHGEPLTPLTKADPSGRAGPRLPMPERGASPPPVNPQADRP